MAVRYAEEATRLGGNAGPIAATYLPVAAVIGGVAGLFAGLAASVAGWLGAVVARRFRLERWGVAFGAGVVAALSVWLVTANLFGLPFEVLSSVTAALLAAFCLARVWACGTVFGRRSPASSTR